MLQAQNAQEESQRMTTVRKVYQKAIVTPTHQLEQLWKDYENFENSVSKQLVQLCFWHAFLDSKHFMIKRVYMYIVCMHGFLIMHTAIWFFVDIRLRDWFLSIIQNIIVPGLSIGNRRNMLMKLTGMLLLYHQLALPRQFSYFFWIC